MKLSDERVLTTHTGSLHRPPDLEELFRAMLAGDPHDEEKLETRLRTALAEVVDKQLDTGIDVIDDGEYSKVDFYSYAKYRMTGLEARPLDLGENPFLHPAMQTVMSGQQLRSQFADFYRETEPPTGAVSPPSLIQMWLPEGSAVERRQLYVCVEPLRYDPREVDRDIANLTAAVRGGDGVEAFLPVVAPAMFASRHPNEYYANEEEYYFAVADVLHEEYRRIVDAGFLLQIDDVSLPGRHRVLAPVEGDQAFHKWADMAVAAMNHALRGIPPERVRYHMCWSSQNTPHVDDVPLRDLVRHVLAINAQGYQLEAANVRHEHEWTVWQDTRLPDDKVLLPGVISHATNVIEHPEYVAQRIGRYADVVGRERVIAATDCGFRWRTHPQIAWAKLETLVEGARLAGR